MFSIFKKKDIIELESEDIKSKNFFASALEKTIKNISSLVNLDGKSDKIEFNTIEEWHSGNERSYLIGTIPYTSLLHRDWWKTNKTSLILMPNNIVENTELNELKKLSLSLAGVEL